MAAAQKTWARRCSKAVGGAALSLSVLAIAPFALADAAADKSAAASSAEERKVCKRIEETGRRTKKRVCYTQRTWDRMREQSQESVRRVRDRSDVSRSGGDG